MHATTIQRLNIMILGAGSGTHLVSRNKEGCSQVGVGGSTPQTSSLQQTLERTCILSLQRSSYVCTIIHRTISRQQLATAVDLGIDEFEISLLKGCVRCTVNCTVGSLLDVGGRGCNCCSLHCSDRSVEGKLVTECGIIGITTILQNTAKGPCITSQN